MFCHKKKLAFCNGQKFTLGNKWETESIQSTLSSAFLLLKSTVVFASTTRTQDVWIFYPFAFNEEKVKDKNHSVTFRVSRDLMGSSLENTLLSPQKKIRTAELEMKLVLTDRFAGWEGSTPGAVLAARDLVRAPELEELVALERDACSAGEAVPDAESVPRRARVSTLHSCNRTQANSICATIYNSSNPFWCYPSIMIATA